MSYSTALHDSNGVPPNAGYSLPWAFGVVQKLMDSSSRAPYFFGEIMGLSRKQLAIVLAKRPEEWRFLKAAYHQYDNWMKRQGQLAPGWGENERRSVVDAVKFVKKCKGSVNCPEKLGKYIDMRLKITESQGAVE